MKSILCLVSIVFLIDQIQVAAASVNSREGAFEWLDKYGYNPCSGAAVQCSSDLGSILKEFQRRFGLKVTGELDSSTIRQMNKPRCGVQDKLKLKSGGPMELSAYKWTRSSLKYSIHAYPTQISQEVSSTKHFKLGLITFHCKSKKHVRLVSQILSWILQAVCIRIHFHSMESVEH